MVLFVITELPRTVVNVRVSYIGYATAELELRTGVSQTIVLREPTAINMNEVGVPTVPKRAAT